MCIFGVGHPMMQGSDGEKIKEMLDRYPRERYVIFYRKDAEWVPYIPTENLFHIMYEVFGWTGWEMETLDTRLEVRDQRSAELYIARADVRLRIRDMDDIDATGEAEILIVAGMDSTEARDKVLKAAISDAFRKAIIPLGRYMGKDLGQDPRIPSLTRKWLTRHRPFFQ